MSAEHTTMNRLLTRDSTTDREHRSQPQRRLTTTDEADGAAEPIDECSVYSVGPVRSGHCIELERSGKHDALRITGSGGAAELRIRFTHDGLELSLNGAALYINASDTLSVNARRIALSAAEDIVIAAGRDLVHSAAGDHATRVVGDLRSEARIQNIVARLGNVNVKANDDVRLNGERIMMNC